jgi:predicted DNA repair protein MutK
MASGLLALLDDVAAIAKLAAASLDDVAAATGKAATKSAGVVVDDTAVTPGYVMGFRPERELPIVWKIARGSLRNKLLILMPGFIALAALLPQALTPLLMLGGAFLCYEAAEKVLEKTGLHGAHAADAPVVLDPAARESSMVNGAIRTDLILSAEILAIALGELQSLPIATIAAALAGVSLAVTILVYGAVALIVKMDDIGLHLARQPNGASQALGRGLVAGMPKLLATLGLVGIAAMAWVGGGIVLHGMAELEILVGIPQLFHELAHRLADHAPALGAAVDWIANAALAGLFGLALGLAVVALIGLLGRVRTLAARA